MKNLALFLLLLLPGIAQEQAPNLAIEAASNHSGEQWSPSTRGGIPHAIEQFADAPHLQDYAAGKVPAVIAAQEEIAEYYQIPSLDFAKLISSDHHTWQEFGANCHVNAFGQRYYARYVLEFLQAQVLRKEEMTGQTLPEQALDEHCWTNGQMIPPDAATKLQGAVVTPDWTAQHGSTRPGFVHIPVLEAMGAGSGFSFEFSGSGAGFWTLAGPDAATFRWRVDGGPWTEASAWTRWSGGLNLPWIIILSDGLKLGKHRMDIEVLAKQGGGQPGGETLRVAWFLVH